MTRESIPFFNDIPTKAIPAAARLFDAVRAAGFSFPVAYSDFVSALNEVKIDPPARPLVKRWVGGVQMGHVVRPSLTEEGNTRELETALEKLTPVTFGGSAFATLMEANISPPEPDDTQPDPALALVARQMVEEEVARINMSVRVQATANVAARLRQMAVCLEGGEPLLDGKAMGAMVYSPSRAR